MDREYVQNEVSRERDIYNSRDNSRDIKAFVHTHMELNHKTKLLTKIYKNIANIKIIDLTLVDAVR